MQTGKICVMGKCYKKTENDLAYQNIYYPPQNIKHQAQ